MTLLSLIGDVLLLAGLFLICFGISFFFAKTGLKRTLIALGLSGGIFLWMI